jgi:hypothetical protein
VEGIDVTRRPLYKVTAWFQWRYDNQCREGLKALWALVKEDGCVMANPLTGQLEGDGWHIYVQYGTSGVEYHGATLLEAVEVALKGTPAVVEEQDLM